MDFTTYEPRISALEAGGGGGGDSDFSTAIVTFVNSNQPASIQVSMPVLYEGAIDLGFTVPVNSTQVREVILYKGHSASGNAMDADNNYLETATVTGGVEFDDGSFDVSGDGTITF